ncbi:MAG: phosphatase PAP2 family protein, partial [Rubrivivax sp.]
MLLLLAWDASGLDIVLIQAAGSSNGFAWRDAWWASRVLHDGGRLLGWLTLAALVVNIWRPWWTGPSWRERATWVLITLVCLLLVPAFKRISATSCPWDLQVFGGVAAYVSHWQFGVKDGGPGHCFPSGHAVAAFAFISGWFALRPHAPRAARWWLAGVLVLGVLFGWPLRAAPAFEPEAFRIEIDLSSSHEWTLRAGGTLAVDKDGQFVWPFRHEGFSPVSTTSLSHRP